ncbi:MAG: penicillin acylase family protein [Armatimonadota bacterium]|nr:MAG: penicillin acylase family protein [Armatimonadota bacterium]
MSPMARRLFVLGVMTCLLCALSGAWAYDKEVVTVGGEQVTIVRDDYGVPHVFADTEKALFYGNGYAVAQDRLMQLEKYRRAAVGTLAEAMGKSFVDHDKDVRLHGYTELELELQFRNLAPRFQVALEAYADGVNAWAQKAKAEGKMPGMMTALGLDFAPWRPSDTVAISAMMARRFGGGGGHQLMVLRMYKELQAAHGDAADGLFDDITWMNDPDAATTIPPGEGKVGQLLTPQPLPQVKRLAARLSEEHLDRAIEMADWARAHEDFMREAGIAAKWGSYAVLIGPQRSAGGNAILLGGPQMGFETPQIAHEIHLCGAGLNVMGMGFAGVPAVLIGRNEHVAWSTTTAVGPVEDIFVETLDPGNKYRYLHNGEYKDMEKRIEVIGVRGEQPVELEVYRTVHGPVIEWDEKAGIAYSHAMNYWMREMGVMDSVFGYNQAENIADFARAAAFGTTAHNWFCATQDGDIGFWHCGKVPRRSSAIDLRLPIPGTGEYDWQGDVPFSEMPQIINPRQGYLCNWNNKPAVWWAPGEASPWGAVFRLRSIKQAIAKQDLHTLASVRDLQKDYGLNYYYADYFKQYLLDAAARKRAWTDPRMREALRHLKAWDNHAVNRSVASSIFSAWHKAILAAVFADEFTGTELFGKDVGEMLRSGDIEALDRFSCLLYRSLRGAKAALPVQRDYWNGVDRDQMMVDALGAGLNELEKRFGTPQMSKWMHEQGKIKFDPLPWIPMYSRGTYIQVVECAQPDLVGINILPPGQNEDPKSSHFGDQRELAGYWMFKDMVFDREKLLQ